MSRAKWKGPYIKLTTVKKILKVTDSKLSDRAATILPNFVGKTLNIHNGFGYIKLIIKKEMVGYKLGEFAPTRKKFIFKKSKKHGTKNKR